MIDLRQEREIFQHDRDEPQILDGRSYVENAHLAVGYASTLMAGDSVFDTQKALQLSNELCAYMRLLKEGKAS